MKINKCVRCMCELEAGDIFCPDCGYDQRQGKCVRCMCELEAGDIFCSDCGYDQRQGNSERALPIGTILNDKYAIGAVIGEGGFGITYVAWDMLIKTRIAIKEYFPSELVTRNTAMQKVNVAHNLTLIREKGGESRYREGLERFVKEAWNLAKFQKYLGIVSVKDFFYENNTAYMVMEYIDGVTLNSYLESHNGKLGKEETFRMMEPVMKTLEAIHKEGVIHRDISPDNIMVTADGQMKLIDFGAARFVGVDDEKSLTVILRHGYAPEEQYRSNGEQGPWTDVYALSAVMYRMLTGKVPEETLKRMTEKQDSVHIELKTVPSLSKVERKGLEKGLAVKDEKRLRTMGELLDKIHSKGKYTAWKWAVGAAALLAVTFDLYFGLYFARMQDKEDEGISVKADVQRHATWEADTPVLEKETEVEKDIETEMESVIRGEKDVAQVPEEVELKSFSEEELVALIEEYSGKYIGENVRVYTNNAISNEQETKKSACYDDFDGDGRYELFAYVADEWECGAFDMQDGSSRSYGSGSSIWFSDGEQTVWVSDIEDWLILYEIGTLQFGKNKHFYLCQGVGTLAGGSMTTTYALDENIPHPVLQDEFVTLGSEDGRTYCWIMQDNPYALGNATGLYNECYSIFYKDGEYWEYASRLISEAELQQYTNGNDILNEIIEKVKKLNVEWGNDYSDYSYIEVESILLNSEYGEIIVNTRHWKNLEEAEYYKKFTGDDLIHALYSRDSFLDGDACLLSETRLSVKDNRLQIEEMKFGHKEVKGTEFTPLYPN